MTAQQLKNSILQLAIQGKLVPQDPNDEPASVLLERIRKEKEKLVKQGKIKKDKNPSVIFRGEDNLFYEKQGLVTNCVQDELPFEIPENWGWARLGDVFSIVMGQSPSGNSVSNNPSGMEFHQGKIFFGNVYLQNSDSYTSQPNKIAPANTILLCVRAPVGKINITVREICIGRGLCSLEPLAQLNLWYAYYLLVTNEELFIKQSTGTTFKAITADIVKKQLLPIPPLAEQRRIVAQLETILPHVEAYGEKETELTQLNATFPETLKKSILQEAIQGRLVPQDPNDEPAFVLLERIRKEKALLVKQGKIKKDKKESIIVRRGNSQYEKIGLVETCIDEQLPFEIPESWTWARLGSVCEIINGDRGKNYPAKSKLFSSGIPFVSAINLNGKSVIADDRLLCMSEDQYNKLRGGKLIKGDIIVCIRGSLGKHGQYQYDRGAIASSLVIVRSYGNCILKDYLSFYLDTPLFQLEIRKYDNGTAQPNLAAHSLEQFLLPIPPLAEQRRIVAQLETLLPLCKELLPTAQ